MREGAQRKKFSFKERMKTHTLESKEGERSPKRCTSAYRIWGNLHDVPSKNNMNEVTE